MSHDPNVQPKRSLKRVLESANSVPSPDPSHPLAWQAYYNSRTYKELSDYESRLQDLVKYFGYEIGRKAPYTRIYEGEKVGWLEILGLLPEQYGIMHMHSLFNRLDPERHDMYYVMDDVVKTAYEKFGEDFCVVDFGCGLGGIGIAFASLGIKTYCIDIYKPYIDFIKSRVDAQGLQETCIPVYVDHPFAYESLNFPEKVGVVIEWSSFEHILSPLRAYKWCHKILQPGGQFVTTTSLIDWTPEVEAHFLDDAGPERFAELRSDEYTNMRYRFADTRRYDKSLAVVMTKGNE